jgi:hypothetical protein
MTNKQKEIINLLNAMYCSQSIDYQKQYSDNYFRILEFIVNSPEISIGCSVRDPFANLKLPEDV